MIRTYDFNYALQRMAASSAGLQQTTLDKHSQALIQEYEDNYFRDMKVRARFCWVLRFPHG